MNCILIGLGSLAISIVLSYALAEEPAQENEQLKAQIRALQQELMQSTRIESKPAPRVSAPKTGNEMTRNTMPEVSTQAFNEAMQSALPLSPEQIKQLRQQFNQTQAAIASHPDIPPRPIIASRHINLAPGSTPMVIRLAQGYVSTLAFLDSTGQPWPIESYNIGDPQAFNVQWDKKSNLMMIQATTLYNTGNLAVQLKGLNVPVMLTLISGQRAVDYRLDMRVSGEGPHAKPLLGRALPQHVAPELLSILDGVPPQGSTTLTVTGGNAQAWLVGKRLYLRTRLTLLSPAWIATLSSLDGTKAYELPKTSLILGSNNGQTVQLKLQGL
jgi:intracellular multiplication protein IcmK